MRRLRRVVTGALEVERAAKRIGSSLQAHPRIWAAPEYRQAVGDLDLAELAITSAASLEDGEPPADAFQLPDVGSVAVRIERAQGQKCERCWQVLPDVGVSPALPGLCGRCVEAVEQRRAAAE